MVTDVLGCSGGDFVNINVAEAFIERGFWVEFLTTDRSKLIKAYENFGKTMSKSPHITSSLLRLPNPYITIAGLLQVSRIKPDVLFLNDDVPKGATRCANSTIVYIHFPHLARVQLGVGVSHRYRASVIGRLLWETHRNLFSVLFEKKLTALGDKLKVVANSSYTKNIIDTLSPGLDSEIVYPPVDSSRILTLTRGASKEDVVLFSGRIIEEKGVHEIVLIANLLALRGIRPKFRIIGPISDYSYLEYLKSLIDRFDLSKTVKIEGTLTRDNLIKAYSEARVYLHPAEMEPFGISVVEAMAAGCVPVAKKGNNGPTLDIIGKNELYGMLYTTLEEAANKVEQAMVSYDHDQVRARALQFDAPNFRKEILKSTD